MEELLANPAVQAAAVPFVAGSVAAALLSRTRLPGLAVVAAFASAVALTIGFSFESLTAARKLVLIGLATAVAIVALPEELSRLRSVRWTVAAAAGALALWMLWRVLAQQEPPALYWKAAGAALYVAALVGCSLEAAEEPIRAASISMILGLTAGGLALMGASALLAQLGISVGAGAGAVLLMLLLLARSAPPGRMLALPAATIAGLIGVLAVFTGSLPWIALLPTLLIPWAALLVRAHRFRAWAAAALTALAAAVPMAASFALAWFQVST